MAYAPADRAFYDADSHIMELPDFLKAYADPKLRDEIPEVSYSASVVTCLLYTSPSPRDSR